MIVPSGVIVAWPSTNASIPTGFSRVTAMDGLYPKGIATNGTAPGATGGTTHTHSVGSHSHAQSHDHANSNTQSGPTGGAAHQTTGTGVNMMSSGSHTHAVNWNVDNTATDAASGTTSTGVIALANLTMVFIKSAGTHAMPSGVAAWWDKASAPPGWAYMDGAAATPDSRGEYWVGAAAAGDGGTVNAAAAHLHPLNHTHTYGSHVHSGSIVAVNDTNDAVSSGSVSATGVDHGHSIGSISTVSEAPTSGAASSDSGNATPEPPYIEMLPVKSTGSDTVQSGIICMWDGALGSIPSGWRLCDGTKGTPNLINVYVKGAASGGSVGTTGGTATHDHTGTHAHAAVGSHSHAGTGTSATSSPNVNVSNASVTSNKTAHTHDAPTNTGSITSASVSSGSSTLGTADNDPPYIGVAYIQYRAYSAVRRPTWRFSIRPRRAA